VTRRAAYRPAAWSQMFQAGHGWTAGGAGLASSNLNDTSTFIRGTQSASVTTAANGIQSQIRSVAVSPPSLAGKMIRLIFKVDNVTHLGHIAFYLGTSSFANFFQWIVHTHSGTAGQQNYVQSGEWVTVDLQWADVVTASGTFTISSHGVPSVQTGFTCMQFAVYDDAAGAVTAHLQAVEIVPDTTATFPNGVVSVCFDDSYQNMFTNARPAMDALGYRGTLFTIADVVAASNGTTYLTVSQLQQLASASGWDIQGHAYTDVNHQAGYNTLTALQVQNEMRWLRAWMLSKGFAGDVFAYPHGWFGNTTDNVPVEQIAQQYWSAARCIISETAEPAPAPAMPWRIKSVTGINDGAALGGTTVANLVATGGLLDRCASDGSWLILTFHQVITGTPSDSTMCTQAGFQTVMTAVSAAGMPVLPVADVIRYYN
jgi:peptidoglycan/xylan/chitin deacetylase (PgdA/CDA1 family)